VTILFPNFFIWKNVGFFFIGNHHSCLSRVSIACHFIRHWKRATT
jgi:hypothetical protein